MINDNYKYYSTNIFFPLWQKHKIFLSQVENQIITISNNYAPSQSQKSHIPYSCTLIVFSPYWQVVVAVIKFRQMGITSIFSGSKI